MRHSRRCYRPSLFLSALSRFDDCHPHKFCEHCKAAGTPSTSLKHSVLGILDSAVWHVVSDILMQSLLSHFHRMERYYGDRLKQRTLSGSSHALTTFKCVTTWDIKPKSSLLQIFFRSVNFLWHLDSSVTYHSVLFCIQDVCMWSTAQILGWNISLNSLGPFRLSLGTSPICPLLSNLNKQAENIVTIISLLC